MNGAYGRPATGVNRWSETDLLAVGALRLARNCAARITKFADLRSPIFPASYSGVRLRFPMRQPSNDFRDCVSGTIRTRDLYKG